MYEQPRRRRVRYMYCDDNDDDICDVCKVVTRAADFPLWPVGILAFVNLVSILCCPLAATLRFASSPIALLYNFVNYYFISWTCCGLCGQCSA